MTFEELRAYLDSDATVKEAFEKAPDFVSLLKAAAPKPTVEDLAAFMGRPEAESLVKAHPAADRRVTEALAKRDKEHQDKLDAELSKRLAAELLKRNPDETPDQKMIRELNERVTKAEKDRELESRRRALIEKATEYGVEPFFLADYVPASVEEGELYIKRIKDHDTKVMERKAAELLAGGYKPGSGEGSKKKMDLSKLSQSDLVKLEMAGTLDSELTA